MSCVPPQPLLIEHAQQVLGSRRLQLMKQRVRMLPRQCGHRAARHEARGPAAGTSSKLLFARRFRGGDAAVMARGASFVHPRTVVLRHVRAHHPHVLSSAQHNHSHHNLAHHPLVTLCPGRCILQPQAPQPVVSTISE